MARMALHPVPLDLMLRGQRIETLPQIDILHRLLVGSPPSAALPVVNPYADALLHILRVGVEIHMATAALRRKAFDHRSELHAIVGCVRLPAVQFAHVRSEAHEHAPAAGAGVPLART